MTSCRKIVTSLSFFQFMANLEQSESRIPGTWSVKLTFSLIVTFYLKKLKTKQKNPEHSSVALSKSTTFNKKC